MVKNTDGKVPSLIFLFVDGVGVGSDDPARNPFCHLKETILPFIPSQQGARADRLFRFKAIDATLGIEGIPQSGSGQTTLFTGTPYPRISGEHAGSYPTQAMRQVLTRQNLLRQLRAAGHEARFFNAYPFHAPLFSPPHLNLNPDGSLAFSETFPTLFRRRISATTVMMLSIKQPVPDEISLQQKTALYQDYSNRSLISRGADLNPLSPREAGEILGQAGRELPGLTLFEFFLSDQTGHRGTMSEAISLLKELSEFTSAAVSALDAQQHTLLICSDHGNIEEMDHSGHTRNPVPLWVWGKGRDYLSDRIESIADVTPAILQFFSEYGL